MTEKNKTTEASSTEAEVEKKSASDFRRHGEAFGGSPHRPVLVAIFLSLLVATVLLVVLPSGSTTVIVVAAGLVVVLYNLPALWCWWKKGDNAAGSEKKDSAKSAKEWQAWIAGIIGLVAIALSWAVAHKIKTTTKLASFDPIIWWLMLSLAGMVFCRWFSLSFFSFVFSFVFWAVGNTAPSDVKASIKVPDLRAPIAAARRPQSTVGVQRVIEFRSPLDPSRPNKPRWWMRYNLIEQRDGRVEAHGASPHERDFHLWGYSTTEGGRKIYHLVQSNVWRQDGKNVSEPGAYRILIFVIEELAPGASVMTGATYWHSKVNDIGLARVRRTPWQELWKQAGEKTEVSLGGSRSFTAHWVQ